MRRVRGGGGGSVGGKEEGGGGGGGGGAMSCEDFHSSLERKGLVILVF